MINEPSRLWPKVSSPGVWQGRNLDSWFSWWLLCVCVCVCFPCVIGPVLWQPLAHWKALDGRRPYFSVQLLVTKALMTCSILIGISQYWAAGHQTCCLPHHAANWCKSRCQSLCKWKLLGWTQFAAFHWAGLRQVNGSLEVIAKVYK